MFEFLGFAKFLTAFFGVFIFFFLIVLIAAIIDIYNHKELKQIDKMFWLLIVFFSNIIGVIIYFVVVRIMDNFNLFKINKKIPKYRTKGVLTGSLYSLSRFFKIDVIGLRVIFILLVFLINPLFLVIYYFLIKRIIFN